MGRKPKLLVRHQQIERLPHPQIGLERHQPLHRFRLTDRDGIDRGRTDGSFRRLRHVGNEASTWTTGSTPIRRTRLPFCGEPSKAMVSA